MAGRVAIAFACALAGCAKRHEATAPSEGATTELAPATTDAEELHAFAKLYGYVRWFHPSDEVAAADWDAIAIDGARSVVLAENRDELAEVLRKIFEPVAPTLEVVRVDEPLPPLPKPKDGPVIAWQHEGYGFGDLQSAYFSGRTGRPRMTAAMGAGWAHARVSLDAKPYVGKRLRLRGWARVQAASRRDRAQVLLRVDGAGEESLFFDNMQDRPIVAAEWSEAVIEAPPLAEDAKAIVLGGIAAGRGPVWFDDFTLEAADEEGAWTPIAIDNAGFERGDAGWTTKGEGYTFVVVDGGRTDSKALRVEQTLSALKAELFAERPAVGEAFVRELGAGLRCRVVLGLPTTAPREKGPKPLAQLPGAEEPAVRAAAVIVAWNVLRHFYPYHDVIGEDWDVVLDDAIADVLDDRGAADLGWTLRRLVHRLHDGHGAVSGPVPPTAGLPIRLARIEDTIVVLAAPKDSGVVRGDELVAIDGVPIAKLLERRAEIASGSPQWIEYVLLAWGRVDEGPVGSSAQVELRREGTTKTESVKRGGMPPAEFERKMIEKLPGGIFYIDLDRAPNADIVARMKEIAKAPGVVFDLRGYPQDDFEFLRHLLTKNDSAKWMAVPHVIRPDFEDVTAWSRYGWDLLPAEPHIKGKVAFITGPGAISYAESVMGYVEGYALGAIVGSPTAGTNGNVNPFTVPGGFQITFTGMKVTRMDGRQHHLVGVQPTHPVARTLAGVRAGRDEELEAALALVRR